MNIVLVKLFIVILVEMLKIFMFFNKTCRYRKLTSTCLPTWI
jgi:hypothetical protein